MNPDTTVLLPFLLLMNLLIDSVVADELTEEVNLLCYDCSSMYLEHCKSGFAKIVSAVAACRPKISWCVKQIQSSQNDGVGVNRACIHVDIVRHLTNTSNPTESCVTVQTPGLDYTNTTYCFCRTELCNGVEDVVSPSITTILMSITILITMRNK